MSDSSLSDKEKILNHAHVKFITEGFYKTSMDEISREMQVSKKTIYKFFPSKELLLEEICDLRIRIVNSRIKEIIDSKNNVVTKFIQLLDMNKKMMSACSEKWFRDLHLHAPNLLKKFDELRAEKIFQVMSKLLEQGKREKLLENYPGCILITAFSGAIEAVTDPDFILNNKFTVHDAFIITSEIFMNGFLTPLGKESYSSSKKLFENVSL